jgi:hypothetical protein
MILFLDYLLAEVATIALLIFWRRRIGLLPLVLGWIWAAIGVGYLVLACAEMLGFLPF